MSYHEKLLMEQIEEVGTMFISLHVWGLELAITDTKTQALCIWHKLPVLFPCIGSTGLSGRPKSVVKANCQ